MPDIETRSDTKYEEQRQATDKPDPRYESKRESRPDYNYDPGYESRRKTGYGYTPDPRYDSRRETGSGYNYDPGYNTKRETGYGYDPGYDSRRETGYGYNYDPGYDSRRQSHPGYGYDPDYDSRRESRSGYSYDPRYDARRESCSGYAPCYDTGREARSDLRYNRRQRMRELALGTSNDETVMGLEQVFRAKLNAIHSYEQRLNTVTDPYARRVLQQMIRKERAELLHLSELTDLVEQSPDMNSFTRNKRRVNHEIKMRTGQDLTFWLGAAVVGAVLLPSVREKLRPLAVKTVQGVLGLTDQAQGLFSGMREDIEDLVSEAQFERFKDSLDDPGETGPVAEENPT